MNPLQKINGASLIYDANNNKPKQVDNSFGQVFEETQVQFSKHANMRLDTRNINLSGDQMNRLEKGIEDARNKGIRDSLIMLDNVALVVNVTNRTVITAVEQEKKVFTNIDGAVIV
ncbi:MAG: hypothetical protein FWE02_01870 [Defluviitaleaceae bacterium]|nr:hypothetical protein [Defluviitaleaceae bacterium]